MSDLTVALRLLADTAGAEGGLKKLAASLRDLGADQRRAAAEGDVAADRTAAAWTEAAARIEAAATAPAAVGQNAQIAQGQLGNLTAQFNDIAMMLQAGQNPLQLALQQGTQISQVLGPMGAAGAARALGAAFMSLFSPINLITIGGIAAGAALLQWLTSGTEKALTLDDAMQALEEGVSTYEKSAKAAAQTTAELRDQFGDAAEDARELLREIAQLDGGNAARALAGVTGALRSEQGIVRNDGRTDTGALAEMFDLSRFGRGREQRQALIAAVSQGFAEVDAAAGIEDESQRIDAMAAATRRLRDAFAAAADASGSRSEQEKAILRVLGQQVIEAERLRTIRDAEARADIEARLDRGGRTLAPATPDQAAGAQMRQQLTAEAQISAAIAQHGRDSLEAARARVLAEREVHVAKVQQLALSDTERAALIAQWDATRGISALEAQRRAQAQALLAELQQQGAVQQAIRTYGEDSVQVARLRVDAERDAFAALVDSLVPAGALRDQLMAAWENAEGLGRTDMSGNLAIAAAQARAIADALGQAVANAQSLAAAGISSLQQAEINWEFRNDPVQRARALARAQFDAQTPVPPGADSTILAVIEANRRRTVDAAGRRETLTQQTLAWQRAQAEAARGSSGGGRGGAAARDGLAGLTGEAQKMLAELGLAQAAVSEKVRAGLQSVAEGETEMAQAKRRTAERLADLIARLTALGPAGQAAADQARAALQGLGVQAEAVGRDIRGSIIDSFEDSFARSLATGKSAMSSFADHVQMELARAFTKKFITPMVTPLIDGIMGLFGGIFSAQGNVFSSGRLVPFAKGGVPELPGLGAHADTVVDKPTAFAMALGQIGIMGEAGAEAILPLRSGPGGQGVLATGPDGATGVLPLRRTPGGALGVALPQAPDLPGLMARPTFFAQGGVVGRLSAPAPVGAATPQGRNDRRPLSVVINNNAAGTRVEARERTGGDDMGLEIVVEQIESALAERASRGTGALAGVLGGTFGVTRRAR